MDGGSQQPFFYIGKRARDLLTKGYNFDHKLTISTSSGSGLVLTAKGVRVNELFVGDITSQYKDSNTTVNVKVDTNSNVSTTIIVNEIFPGTKTALHFEVPGHKSGNVHVRYFHKRAVIDYCIGLSPTPLLEFAAAIGSKELCVGTEARFHTASATFSIFNAAIGFSQNDFSAALKLVGKGEILKASYIHIVNPKTAVAAEMIRKLNNSETSFTLGSCHAISPFTVLKTRFGTNGKLAMLCQQQRPKSLVTLSAEYDTKSLSPPRVGLAVALK